MVSARVYVHSGGREEVLCYRSRHPAEGCPGGRRRRVQGAHAGSRRGRPQREGDRSGRLRGANPSPPARPSHLRVCLPASQTGHVRRERAVRRTADRQEPVPRRSRTAHGDAHSRLRARPRGRRRRISGLLHRGNERRNRSPRYCSLKSLLFIHILC